MISSIQDEEIIGKPRAVGVLQLYNRIASDVLQDDLVRVHYIRKLIGSMMIKCEMYTITLDSVIGMALNMEATATLKDKANHMTQGHVTALA